MRSSKNILYGGLEDLKKKIEREKTMSTQQSKQSNKTKQSNQGKQSNQASSPTDAKLVLKKKLLDMENDAMKKALAAQKAADDLALYSSSAKELLTDKSPKGNIKKVGGSPLWMWFGLFGIFFILLGLITSDPEHALYVHYMQFLAIGGILLISAVLSSWVVLIASIASSPWTVGALKVLNVVT